MENTGAWRLDFRRYDELRRIGCTAAYGPFIRRLHNGKFQRVHSLEIGKYYRFIRFERRTRDHPASIGDEILCGLVYKCGRYQDRNYYILIIPSIVGISK